MDFRSKSGATTVAIIGASVAATTVFSAQRASGATQYNTVALSGAAGTSLGAGPNFGAGVNFSTFNAPRINAGGQVAFLGNVAGTGIVAGSNSSGIFTTGGTGIVAVAREGTDGPGPNLGTGVNFNSFGDPVINVAGQVAFTSSLEGTGVDSTNNQAVFSNVGGAPTVVARSGAIGPGPGLATGVLFASFTDARLNGGGIVAFQGALTGTGVTFNSNDVGMFTNRDGSVAAAARAGSAGPGAPSGYPSFNGLGTLSLNSSGQVSFFGTTSGGNIGIATNIAGVTTLVAGENRESGPTSPGLGPGVFFKHLGTNAGSNNAGDVVFGATLGFNSNLAGNPNLDAGPADTTADDVLYISHAGVPSIVAREGKPAPLGAGVNFGAPVNPTVNGAGTVAFVASLSGAGVNSTNDLALVSKAIAAPAAVVARTGSAGPGPGLGVGVNFSTFTGPAAVDANGDVAFLAGLTGAAVSTSSDTGLFTNVGGVIVPIAREGDLFDVDPGLGVDLRTITVITFESGDTFRLNDAGAGGEDGKPTGFNAAGVLTFGLTFSDGSRGVFTASVVPEPATGLILLLAGLPLARWRRSR